MLQVSNGAEVILLSRKLFTSNAPDETISFVKQTVYPYPDRGALQGDLQTHADWDVYKKWVLKDTIKKVASRKSLSAR